MSKSFIKILCLIFIGACQINQENKQLPDEAYVTFSGPVAGCTFQVDDSTSMEISGNGTRYLVEAGAHTIWVKQGSKTVVRQKIYAAPGQTVEVRIR